MNARIKELVEKSYIYDKQNDSSFFNKEKFAELIVRECAEVSSQAEKQCQHPGTMMKKHFGVEE